MLDEEEPGICLDQADEEISVEPVMNIRSMFVCQKCGVLVADLSAHHDWHIDD